MIQCLPQIGIRH